MSEQQSKTTSGRLIGLRHDIVGHEEIKYLLFYDIDRPVTQPELDNVDYLMNKFRIAYMLYRTKNGHHIIGLTPLDALKWSEIFTALKYIFHSYYGGVVIRLSRKKDEQQELITLNEHYGEVVPNLFNLYADRFGLKKKHWIKETSKYLLVFEKYRSMKE